MSSRLLYRGPPMEVLHEDYAKQGRIDERAPVTAARSVQIEAPPHEVWQVLSAGSEWQRRTLNLKGRRGRRGQG